MGSARALLQEELESKVCETSSLHAEVAALRCELALAGASSTACRTEESKGASELLEGEVVQLSNHEGTLLAELAASRDKLDEVEAAAAAQASSLHGAIVSSEESVACEMKSEFAMKEERMEEEYRSMERLVADREIAIAEGKVQVAALRAELMQLRNVRQAEDGTSPRGPYGKSTPYADAI